MVVKSQLKLVKNLQQKKYRTQLQLFVAEGVKTVQELLSAGYRPRNIYCTDVTLLTDYTKDLEIISQRDLKQMSSLKTPNKVLAVFEIPAHGVLPTDGWILALDGVQDPGNLGTIIRLCDWFGIAHIVCSENTVDCFNPKVVQSTMGSIARVSLHYLDLETWLKSYPNTILGAVLDGTNLYTAELPEQGILVMGSESHGITEQVLEFVTKKVTLPQYGSPSAESLNVAMATAICLSELRRTRLLTQM